VNPTEAGQLLAHAAAFDNRKPSAAAAIAWSVALKDVPLDQDAIEAIARYYGQPGDDPNERRWLQPHHVRHHRQQIRNERIDAAKPMYDGNPDETPEEAIDNLRSLIDDAATGRLPSRSVSRMLEAGPEAIRGRKLLELEAAYIGKPIPSRRAGVVNVLGIPCPHCAAPAGQVCVSGRRKKIRHADAHPSRLDAARRYAAGLDDAS
jgi:hypothetical protein